MTKQMANYKRIPILQTLDYRGRWNTIMGIYTIGLKNELKKRICITTETYMCHEA